MAKPDSCPAVGSARCTSKDPAPTERAQAPSGENIRTVLFQKLYVDQVYPSMRGPWTKQQFIAESKRQGRTPAQIDAAVKMKFGG